MGTVFGDKIGIENMTPGGSSGVWATENGVAMTLIDELAYASREDRNNVIVGGGLFSWDGTDLTFTASIEIRNHITAYKLSVTTAASPITLNAAHKVAYVQVTRKPGADANITSATVVAAGSLPNGRTDADMGTLVLAYRTVDGTVYLPWAKKELVAGDTWAFGAGLTLAERIAAHAKPGFSNNRSDTSQLTVAASATTPAAVFINGKLYLNTSNETLDIDTAGRGGLDTGSKAANTVYYLYAIPATSGRTFDLVCSTTGPGTGPTGFTEWSYLGGFRTWGSSVIGVMRSSKGKMLQGSEGADASVTSATIGAKTLVIPTTAKSVYIRPSWTAVNAAGDSLSVASINDASYTTGHSRACTTTAAQTPTVFFEVEILTAQTIYAHASHNSDAIDLYVFGWVEDPMEYK